MSDFSKATPRPWQRIGWQPCGIYGPGDLADSTRVAMMDRREEHDANAALIVEAVNSYDAMKARIAELEAALTALVKWTPRGECNCQPTGDGFHTCPLCRARAAIGKDKG